MSSRGWSLRNRMSLAVALALVAAVAGAAQEGQRGQGAREGGAPGGRGNFANNFTGTIAVQSTEGTNMSRIRFEAGARTNWHLHTAPQILLIEEGRDPIDADAGSRMIGRGGRILGGSLSWEKPQQLAAFSREGPFVTMPVPTDVTVTRQVLAEPEATPGRALALLHSHPERRWTTEDLAREVPLVVPLEPGQRVPLIGLVKPKYELSPTYAADPCA